MKWLNTGCLVKVPEEFSVFSLPYKEQVKYGSETKRQNICRRKNTWPTTMLFTFR